MSLSSSQTQSRRRPSSSTASPRPQFMASAVAREENLNLSRSAVPSRPSTARRSSQVPTVQLQRPAEEEDEEEAKEENIPYPELIQESEGGSVVTSALLPPSTFKPFFPLVKDITTAKCLHPSVYYVFSDDDPEPVSTASLHALEMFAKDQGLLPDNELETRGVGEVDEEIEDRYILVDLTEDGTQVREAVSLSHKWAVTSTKIQPAPVFGGGERGDSESSSNPMLVIEGVEMIDHRQKNDLEGTAKQEKGDLVSRSRRRRPKSIFESARLTTGPEAGLTDVMTAILVDMQAELAALEFVTKDGD